MIQFFSPFEKVTALTFDLDDTLYDNEPIIKKAEDYIIQYINERYFNNTDFMNSKISDLYRSKMKQVIPELENDVSLLRYFMYAEILKDNGYERIVACKEAEHLIHEFIKVRSQIIVPNYVPQVLKELSKKYILISLSNGNVSLKNTILDGCFDIDIRPNINIPNKPDPQIFQQVKDRLHLKGSQICHIGDNETTDVLGAYNSGFRTIWQTQWHGLFKDLKVVPNIMISNLNELLNIL